MDKKVYIILLSWNNWPDLNECLESLKNSDYQNYQVIIVDNDSKIKPKAPNDNIKMIYNKENLGFSGGNNVGIEYALKQDDADYIMPLNDDVILAPNFLSKMIEIAESDERIGMVGPKIYFYDQKDKLWFTGGNVNWLHNKGTMRGYNEIDKGQYDNPKIQDMDYLTGCCLLVKRETLEKIGPMPEEYFGYYEDVDWSYAAKKAGYRTVFVPESKIWHKGSKSFVETSPSYIYYHVRNGLIFANRYAHWYLKPIIHLDVIYRILKQILKILIPKKREWIRPILLGIKDFYLKREGKYENWH